jgi:uncharacterized membrane protein
MHGSASVVGMGTKRGLERIIFFTDAVTAIAITLLILPLVDLVTSLGPHPSEPAGVLLGDNLPEMLAFVVSFLVIARLWMSHHALFEHVDNYNNLLLGFTLLWAFTIVVLPFPTALTYAYPSGPVTVGFYIGTMTLNSALLTVMTFIVRNNPKLESPTNPVKAATVRGSTFATGAFAIALILGIFVPHVNYYGLFLLVIAGPIEGIISSRLEKRAAGAH